MTIYLDRWGKEHVAGENSVIKKRRGIFAACLTRGHILMTWPCCAPDTPELPGGGIEEGETNEEALCREIYEETGVRIEAAEPATIHSQFVRFYADNSDECWDYDQLYWVLKGPAVDDMWFEGEKKAEDALKSMWVPLSALKEMPLHAAHRKVLQEMF